MTLEQLLIVAVVLLVPFFNIIVQLLKRWLEGTAPREVESEVPPILSRERTRQPRLVVAPRGRHAGLRGTPLPTVAPPTATRRRARPHVGNLRDVGRGLVLMTILGPYRALEPPGPRR